MGFIFDLFLNSDFSKLPKILDQIKSKPFPDLNFLFHNRKQINSEERPQMNLDLLFDFVDNKIKENKDKSGKIIDLNENVRDLRFSLMELFKITKFENVKMGILFESLFEFLNSKLSEFLNKVINFHDSKNRILFSENGNLKNEIKNNKLDSNKKLTNLFEENLDLKIENQNLLSQIEKLKNQNSDYNSFFFYLQPKIQSIHIFARENKLIHEKILLIKSQVDDSKSLFDLKRFVDCELSFCNEIWSKMYSVLSEFEPFSFVKTIEM